jgi:hypothetical protein
VFSKINNKIEQAVDFVGKHKVGFGVGLGLLTAVLATATILGVMYQHSHMLPSHLDKTLTPSAVT